MLIYLLLFVTVFVTEAVLHVSDLSLAMILEFAKMYVIEGAGMFMSMSDTLKTFYPITAVFGLSGYYERRLEICWEVWHH